MTSSPAEVPQEFRNRLPLPRQNQVRRDFAQRLKHKPPQKCARVRQYQFRRKADLIPKRNQIQIQRPGFVQNHFRRATKFYFQPAQLC